MCITWSWHFLQLGRLLYIWIKFLELLRLEITQYNHQTLSKSGGTMTCWHSAIAQSLTLTGWSKHCSSSRLHCPDSSEWQLGQVPIDCKLYACMQAGAYLTQPTPQLVHLINWAQQCHVGWFSFLHSATSYFFRLPHTSVLCFLSTAKQLAEYKSPISNKF